MVLCAADNKVLIAKEGGVQVLLGTMRTHPSAAGLLEEACAAIGILSVNGKGTL